MAEVDYQHRPSKAVQRHMIVDVCRRLNSISNLAEYQYVGFGALEFVDFQLMHRALNIRSMTSIECDTGSLERYRFNRPFATVKVMPGYASQVLPELSWDTPSIVWLDYVQRLSDEVISDVSLLCGRLLPGSALFITINAQPERPLAGRRDNLAKLIGEERIPPGVTDASLARWGLAGTQKSILSDVIVKSLRERQLAAEWRQVIDIHYADNAQMQTLGGIIVNSAEDGPGNSRLFDACRFRELDFVRFRGQEALEIRVPMLTAKERRALEEQLPLLDAGGKLEAPWLKERDGRDFVKLYRYLRAEHALS
ncbi:O-methyltransferase [Streptomyces longwoodensis]|uniref:O-methyltransferase n=1 Tax=Streptomyces longwoodensis TaxID=68231 RepID=UPI00381B94B8